MKKLLLLLILSGILLATNLFAQDHLLITEFVITPTAGEFVEIHNPTDQTVDLSNYYITDATFAPDNHFYYNLVTGVADSAGGGSFGDWNARFPDGASIAPGEHQTIAMVGDSLFSDTYGVLPTYEMYEDGSNITNDAQDMREALPGTIDNGHANNVNFGTLSSGEVLILYYWDGASDLVQDIDYVVWQDKAEAVDKTGVSIDGPDADTVESTYAPDTPIDDQTVVNADNDGDSAPHDTGMSAQRRLDVEDVEVWTGGNGMTGHNETSEDTSWKGGIWSIGNEAPTPGRRALTDKAPADSLTIADVNFVRASDIGAMANDDSPFLGDTLSITGIMMQGSREVFLGNRWGGFIQDERGGPWSGFFVIQNDTITPGVENTLINAAMPGDLIRITGVMSEFPTGVNTPSITQFVMITDPVTPIEFVAAGRPLPPPIVLTPGDLGLTGAGNSADPQLSERWEGVRARFENVTVVNNDGTAGGNTMVVGDASGNLIVDDYFANVANAVTNNGGIWPNLPAGTVINVVGFIRGGTSGGFVTINPQSLDDIEIAATPPAIENLARTPAAPTSTEDVVVSTDITSLSSTVASAEVNYRVGSSGPFTQVAMTNGGAYTGSIPAQADGATVEYFITATDAAGLNNMVPADTSSSMFFYTVRDAGLTIYDVQNTRFSNGNSGYNNLEVTVTGIATTDSTDFSFYYLQSGTTAWSGIQILDNDGEVGIGDEVTVSGTVRERFGVTQIFTVTNVTVNSTGNAVPDPVVLTTGELASGSATAENWESMLVRVENVTVTNARPDGFAGFGEFVVDDGSGGVRVDDLSLNSGGSFAGQTPSNLVAAPADTSFPLDAVHTSITGIHYFSFGNFKIAPRNNGDVPDLAVSVEDEEIIPLAFDLAQNYPNPFNPETTISYRLAQQGEITIHIYNILGQRVRTLVDAIQPAGAYRVQWQGVDDRGLPVSSGVYIYQMKAAEFVKVKKMLFLK